MYAFVQPFSRSAVQVVCIFLFTFLQQAQAANFFEKPHPFERNSAMAAIAEGVQDFVNKKPDFLSPLTDSFDQGWVNSMAEVLAGEIHGIRSTSPTEAELRYILPLVAIFGIVYKIDVFNILPSLLNKKDRAKQDQWAALYVYIRTFQEINAGREIGKKLEDERIRKISHVISEDSLRKNVPITNSTLLTLVNRIYEEFFSKMPLFKAQISSLEELQGALKFLGSQEIKAIPLVPSAPTSLVSPIQEKSSPSKSKSKSFPPGGLDLSLGSPLDPSEIQRYFFEELDKLETNELITKEEAQDTENYIKVLVKLAEDEEKFISYAQECWGKIQAKESIINIAYPMLAPHSPSDYQNDEGEGFRRSIEDYIVKMQNDMEVSYMPVFETTMYVFDREMKKLPPTMTEKDLVIATLRIHCSDGMRMLRQVRTFLKINPHYIRDFLTLAFSEGGCIPRRNNMISNWIEMRVKNKPREYVYQKIILGFKDFPTRIGDMLTIYRATRMNDFFATNPSLIYKPTEAIEGMLAFKKIYNLPDFTKWVQDMIRLVDNYRIAEYSDKNIKDTCDMLAFF